MDPKIVADLDAKVAYHPQLRSLLVVRHGYLVYERYWHGDAHTGQFAFSVTKSFTAALVGIALRDHHLKSLDQTVGELLATHLPTRADPRLAKVTVRQLLTMSSGLAGDDPSLGGDPGLMDRLHQSRDWVRHILGRNLVTRAGASFAYSSASSHAQAAPASGTAPLSMPATDESIHCWASGNSSSGKPAQISPRTATRSRSSRPIGRRAAGISASVATPSPTRASAITPGRKASSPMSINRNEAPQIMATVDSSSHSRAPNASERLPLAASSSGRRIATILSPHHHERRPEADRLVRPGRQSHLASAGPDVGLVQKADAAYARGDRADG